MRYNYLDFSFLAEYIYRTNKEKVIEDLMIFHNDIIMKKQGFNMNDISSSIISRLSNHLYLSTPFLELSKIISMVKSKSISTIEKEIRYLVKISKNKNLYEFCDSYINVIDSPISVYSLPFKMKKDNITISLNKVYKVIDNSFMEIYDLISSKELCLINIGKKILKIFKREYDIFLLTNSSIFIIRESNVENNYNNITHYLLKEFPLNTKCSNYKYFYSGINSVSFVNNNSLYILELIDDGVLYKVLNINDLYDKDKLLDIILLEDENKNPSKFLLLYKDLLILYDLLTCEYSSYEVEINSYYFNSNRRQLFYESNKNIYVYDIYTNSIGILDINKYIGNFIAFIDGKYNITSTKRGIYINNLFKYECNPKDEKFIIKDNSLSYLLFDNKIVEFHNNNRIKEELKK